jgi:short-subunit dehydrogenase
VTGASSGLGRGLAARLADRGMFLVLTGRNGARLDETAQHIRRAAPRVKVETVAADLSTRSGLSALLDHVGGRPIEVLVNNAGYGSYGPFVQSDSDREANEVAVDVAAVVSLARAFLPGMLARGSGGILNVASTIAFQPAPYQAVYGASKAFVLSFSQALWAEARAAGVAVTALCPGATRTGFVDALGADVGHTAIYRRLADPEPVIEAGRRALDKGRAVVIPGVRNMVVAASGRFMPREWLALVSARLLRPISTVSRPPIEVRNEIVIRASAERAWDLLADVERWPSWYRACRWVQVESTGRAAATGSAARAASFRWKAHPVVLRSPVVAADRPHLFAIDAAPGACTPSARSLCAPRPTA